MKTKEIKTLIEQYDKYNQDCSTLISVGIDLYEGKHPVFCFADVLFDKIINDNYSIEGADWINWFIFENNLGGKGVGAWDENNTPICQTLDDLLSYVKQYKKRK